MVQRFVCVSTWHDNLREGKSLSRGVSAPSRPLNEALVGIFDLVVTPRWLVVIPGQAKCIQQSLQ